MHADAYRRARTLIGSRGNLIVARVLGAIQSFLLLGLLGILCLFVTLLASRGRARFPLDEASRLPAWAAEQAVPDGDLLHFQNTGIFPLVANNLLEPNPVHRAGAWLVDRISAVLTPLRNNLGALT